MTSLSQISLNIKKKAQSLGFSACGIAKADLLDKETEKLEQWLAKGYQAGMTYMSNNKDKRIDPRKLVENAKSVICVLLNYYPKSLQKSKDAPKVAKYAYGRDYHLVITDKLRQLLEYINTQTENVKGRAFADSAPVWEHAWAVRAGLGWLGKNTQLISKHLGSFHFIGELIIDLELEYDDFFQDEHCGNCTLCMEACPTNALETPGMINANRCISYFTIENRGGIPDELKGRFQNWIFGCDICQDICPWNKNAQPHEEEDLHPHPKLLEMTKEDWYDLTEEGFIELFGDTPIERLGHEGLQRNLRFLNG